MFSSGKRLRTSLTWLVVILAVIMVILLFFRPTSDTKQVTVSQLLAQVKTDMQIGRASCRERV